MGVTLYYVITGEFPYNFPTRNECIEMLSKGKKPPDPISIILGDVQPIPVEERRDDLPKELARAINKAIRKDPSHRFESSAAFQKALEDCLQ
jgi:serine/threonine protein kinase